CEHSCDDEVLRRLDRPRRYAAGIVKSVRFSLGLWQPGLAEAAAPPIQARLEAILSHRSRPRRAWLGAAVLGAGMAGLFLSGRAGSVAFAVARQTLSVPMSAVIRLPAAIVAAPMRAEPALLPAPAKELRPVEALLGTPASGRTREWAKPAAQSEPAPVAAMSASPPASSPDPVAAAPAAPAVYELSQLDTLPA